MIRVRQGIAVELVFDRQESGTCTSRVVFPNLRVSAGLPAYQRTTVRVSPAEAGTFGFACGASATPSAAAAVAVIRRLLTTPHGR